MFRIAPLLTTAALLAAAGAAPAQTVVRDGSEIGFVTRQMGVPIEGRFTQWQAQLVFDPKAPAAGKVAFSIDTGSARLGNAESDEEVKKADWFHVARFPQARFESKAIRAVGPGRFEVAGTLQIKGQARDVVVPVSLQDATATGGFTIKRLAFGIGAGEWADTSIVADDVQVRFKLALTGLPK